LAGVEPAEGYQGGTESLVKRGAGARVPAVPRALAVPPDVELLYAPAATARWL